ncbi:hypothetical protein FRB99_008679 [Tulasnella sp. 403]|nr:hypothetical protein FRB99_008679 [Tulasnella sp. 403]
MSRNQRMTRSSTAAKPPVEPPSTFPFVSNLPTPSLKALGKQPERHIVSDGAVVDSQSKHSAKTKGDQTKEKKREKPTDEPAKRRVLPARTRRGGPGIGSSAVDVMILESQQRSAETKFIIPPEAVFLITTDPSLVPPPPKHHHQSHFEKPEVMSASKKQEMIQTPEFSLLSEGSAVGSRLRARADSEETADTSDAVYIRRHRKYETFEKRQRMREKEKLQYEHFKLRERIDELKAMDLSAFGTDGANAEEKKRSMLKEAEELDKRYAVLLPGSGEKRGAGRGRKGGMDAEDRASSLADNSDFGVSCNGSIRLRLKRGKGSLPAAPRDAEEDKPGEAEFLPSSTGIKKEGEDEIEVDDADEEDQLIESEEDLQLSPPRPRALQPLRNSPPARKRVRLINGSAAPSSPGSNPRPRAHSTSLSQPTVSILLQTALSSKPVAQPNAKRRQAVRHPLAFGVNMPPTMDVQTEYELPRWIVRDVEAMREAVDQDQD